MYALDTLYVFCDDFDTLLLELASYAEHSFEQLFNFISNIFHSPQVQKRVKWWRQKCEYNWRGWNVHDQCWPFRKNKSHQSDNHWQLAYIENYHNIEDRDYRPLVFGKVDRSSVAQSCGTTRVLEFVADDLLLICCWWCHRSDKKAQ